MTEISECPQATSAQPTLSIAVIVPTFRRPDLLRRLLDSLRAGTVVPDEVIVVNNDVRGSIDVSNLPKGTRLVEGGFKTNVTAARNLGWRACQSELCIFIDDDNEVDPECMESLWHACEDKEVGIAGPITYAGNTGEIWCAGTKVSEWTGFTRCLWNGWREPPGTADLWPTDTVPNMYALRRDVLEQLGGLDELAFPICGEEEDLANRVAYAGLERVIIRNATVRHFGNVSENPGSYLISGMVRHGQERVE